MLRTSILCSTAAFLLLFGSVTSVCAVTYEMHVLGSGHGMGINSSGTIAGYYGSVSTGWLPCKWDLNGVRTDLPLPSGVTSAGPGGINDAGVIAGFQSSSPIIRWNTDGSMDTASLTSGMIMAIDDAGNAYGSARDGSMRCAIEWTTNGQIINVDTSYARVVAVNSSGVMAGFTGISDYVFHSALWTSPGNRTGIPDLERAVFGSARGINDSGVVVGYCAIGDHYESWADSYDYTRPYVWTSSLGSEDLGVLPGCIGGEAMAINTDGCIVGRSYGVDGVTRHEVGYATLWTPDGEIIELGRPSDSTWCTAVAINSSGQIAGYTSDGRALLWTPVPEPSTFLALICGVSGLAFVRRKR